MKHLQLYNDTYKAYHDGFTAYLKALGYKKGTQKMLPSCLKEFLHQMELSGKYPIDTIKKEDILMHYGYLQTRPNRRRPGNLSGSMINQHMYSIRLFFAWLEKTAEITTNPTSGLEIKRFKSEPRHILSQEEIKLLYSICETYRDKAILGVFYGCGLRRNEGYRLNRQDINLKTKLLDVKNGKGDTMRTVPINKTVADDFYNYLYYERHQNLAFPSNETAFLITNRGNRMGGGACNKRLKELIQLTQNEGLADKCISLHSLRHSIATHLLENGMGAEFTRDFLGHKHLESTQVYTRINLKKHL